MRPPNTNPPTPTLPRPQPVRPVVEPYRPSFMSNTMLPGFFVNSEEDISGRDVPNDGSISFFPFRDLSKIVIKQWDGNVMDTAVYVLVSASQPGQQQTQQAPLPPPPLPVVNGNQPQPQQVSEPIQPQGYESLIEGFQQMNNGLARAFGQLTASMESIQANLERLNSRFIDEEAMG